MRDVAVPGNAWRKEKAYPATVLHALLWPWLRQHAGQEPITGLQLTDDGVHYDTEEAPDAP